MTATATLYADSPATPPTPAPVAVDRKADPDLPTLRLAYRELAHPDPLTGWGIAPQLSRFARDLSSPDRRHRLIDLAYEAQGIGPDAVGDQVRGAWMETIKRMAKGDSDGLA